MPIRQKYDCLPIVPRLCVSNIHTHTRKQRHLQICSLFSAYRSSITRGYKKLHSQNGDETSAKPSLVYGGHPSTVTEPVSRVGGTAKKKRDHFETLPSKQTRSNRQLGHPQKKPNLIESNSRSHTLLSRPFDVIRGLRVRPPYPIGS